MQCTGCTRERTQGLLSGDTVCTWCPSWATECAGRDKSARSVLRISERHARERWLAGYEREHGSEAAERLRNVVRAMWPDRAEILGRLASKGD